MRPKTHIVQSEKLSPGTHTTTEMLPTVPGPWLGSRHVHTDSPDDSPAPAHNSCAVKLRHISDLRASAPAFADGGERTLHGCHRPSASSPSRPVFATLCRSHALEAWDRKRGPWLHYCAYTRQFGGQDNRQVPTVGGQSRQERKGAKRDVGRTDALPHAPVSPRAVVRAQPRLLGVNG